MIRDATFSDIPALLALIEGGFMRSHYALSLGCEVDRAETKRLLMTSIQRHGGIHGGATWIRVSVSPDGVVRGFIVAALDRAYGILNLLSASDRFFIADPDVPPADPFMLAKGMVEWAKGNHKVIEIKVGTTMAIMDDPMKAGVIWSRLGLKHYGEIWRLECRG